MKKIDHSSDIRIFSKLIRNMNNLNKNKRGQIFIISVIIAISIALGTSFILLTYLYDGQSRDQAIGKYQSSIIDSLSTANTVQNYVSSAYSQAINNAIYEYLHENPKPKIGSLDEDGGLDLTDVNYCGNYIYRVWNSNNKNCYPDIYSKTFELNNLIDSNLAELTTSQKHTGGIEKQNFWSIVDQKISYDYKYSVLNGKTTINAKANENYNIYMFNGVTTATSESVQDYISSKKYDFATSGGDIIGVPFIPAGAGHFTPSDGTRQIKYIVIHSTAGSSIEGAEFTFQEPGKVTSAHYIVGSTRDKYRVTQMVLDKDLAHHGGCRKTGTENVCGKEEYTFGMNKMSLGIEVVNLANACKAYGLNCDDTKKYTCVNDYIINGINYLPGKNCWEKYPPEQYKKVVALTALLTKKYNVPVTRQNIIGHIEILKPGTGHVDPGPLMDMDKFVSDVQSKMSNDISSLESEITTGMVSSCIKSDNSKWSYDKVSLSSNKLISSEILKISTEILNDGEGCVPITTQTSISYNVNGKSYVQSNNFNLNSYPSTDKIPKTKVQIDCSFTIDDKDYESRKDTECVLLVPSDGSETTYTLEFSITDGSETKKYGEKLSFTSKKSSITASSQSITINTQSLTTAQKNKITSTKNNLEKLQVIEYINEQSEKTGIPRDIILGLITQESGGDMNAKSSAGAYGLMQVMPETYEDKYLKFEDKCSWEEYQKDVKCQIRAGVAVLKLKYDGIKGDKKLYYICNKNCFGTSSSGKPGYWSSCNGGCDQNKCMGPVSKTYSGWEAALRRYNGGGSETEPKPGEQSIGCQGYPDYEYVERVMTYAKGWGYTEVLDQTVKEEVNQGILGTYSYKNNMQKTIDIDFELFNIVSNFAKSTATECSNAENRLKCINDKTVKFNENIDFKYKQKDIKFDECDIDSYTKNVNKFLEELNDCATSQDDNCQCKFTFNSNGNNIGININSIESNEDYTKITYNSESENHKAYLDFKIASSDNKAIIKKDVTNSYLNFYKKDGHIYQGSSQYKTCNAPKNNFRLCLYTGYEYNYFDKDNSKFIQKKFMIPFAITLKDGVAPKIIEGFSQSNLVNDKNSIVLKWTPGNEDDIASYNIYYSDSLDFLKNTQTVELKSRYHTVIPVANKEYEEYQNIDLNNPKCELRDNSDSKYCIFKYDAKDKDGNDVIITLSKEKLYYISLENKFMYVLDGKLENNNLKSGVDTFTAITAVDVDNMEIDNFNSDQKFDETKNIVKITPKNTLTPGFVVIKNLEIETLEPNNYVESIRKIMKVSWTSTNIYIDGTPIEENVEIKYLINTASFNTCLDDDLVKLSDFDRNEGPYSEMNADLYISNNEIYCVGISAIIEDGSEIRKYDAVISRSLNSPINSNPFYNIN